MFVVLWILVKTGYDFKIDRLNAILYENQNAGVIAFFNKTYVKENLMERGLSKIIKDTSYLREKSDYDDFFIASKEEAERQLLNAKYFVSVVDQFIKNEIS